MTASTSFNGRGINVPRLAIVLIILAGLVLLRDSWLPRTTSSFRTTPSSATGQVYATTTATADDYRFTPESPSTPEKIDLDETNEQLSHNEGINSEIPQIENHGPEPDSVSCLTVPGADKILVLLKTGATEIYDKLPTHLLTLLECVPNFMLFSDLEQQFAEFPVHDAIAPVSKHIRQQHEDFELYRKLQTYQREGQDLGQLKGTGGWNLDKWKFLPILHQAFEKADASIEWFFLMEADTSVSWTNLLQWVKTMDPKDAYYLGSQNSYGKTTFAHGGSGVLISRRAADMLTHERNKDRGTYDLDWEDKTAASCCGDVIVADAFYEAGVELSPAWPLIQGERVGSIDWTSKHWCLPSVTWHHVTPIEVDALWQFQAQWVRAHGWDEPYLFRDVFIHFIDQHITVNRTAWNNLSDSKKLVAPQLASQNDLDYSTLQEFEQRAVDSEASCAEACVLQTEFECVQWMYSPGRCHLGKDVRFGRSDERGSGQWTSGWIQDRWSAFKDAQEPCEVRWRS